MLDGKIVLLGSDHDAVTFLHYVEHVADIPGKRIARYEVPVIENGSRVWRVMEEFDTSGAGAHPTGQIASSRRLSTVYSPRRETTAREWETRWHTR
jgi:aminoglycoside N3'-acetyltransferase